MLSYLQIKEYNFYKVFESRKKELNLQQFFYCNWEASSYTNFYVRIIYKTLDDKILRKPFYVFLQRRKHWFPIQSTKYLRVIHLALVYCHSR